MPRIFIVDACLAVEAGSKNPPVARGARVRAFLTAILANGHSAAFTEELEEEWRTHAALFARRWLVSMRARRRIPPLITAKNNRLCCRVLALAPNDNVYDDMKKDWHLIEAALSTDRLIASADDTACGYYKVSAVQVAALKAIVWVNPAANGLSEWVENGAPHDDDKRLA